jgi:hypothetical protein
MYKFKGLPGWHLLKQENKNKIDVSKELTK